MIAAIYFFPFFFFFFGFESGSLTSLTSFASLSSGLTSCMTTSFGLSSSMFRFAKVALNFVHPTINLPSSIVLSVLNLTTALLVSSWTFAVMKALSSVNFLYFVLNRAWRQMNHLKSIPLETLLGVIVTS